MSLPAGVWSPGVVLVGERYRANTLADKVDREGHLEEGFHLTWMKIQLLKSDRKNQKVAEF